MLYQIMRDVAEQAKPAAHTAQANTTLAKRTPEIVIHDTVNITPQDLNSEIPAVDSSLLVKYITSVLNQYARFEKREHVITIALWIASTWFAEPTPDQGMTNGRMMFGAHPRLMLIGDKGAGKNRVAKIIRRLVRNPTAIGSGVVTSYGVRNALESGMTVIIDEYHKRVGSTGRKQSDLQELVLAYSQEEGSIDGQGGKYNEHDLFGPMMLLAQPSILKGIQGDMLEDLFDRSFIIPMTRNTNPNDVIDDLDDDFEAKCGDLRAALELWAAGLYEMMSAAQSRYYMPIHTVPKNLTARMREISLPLLAVADRCVNPDVLASQGSDLEWAKMARNAVQVVLLGHGDNAAQVMSSLRDKFGQIT